MKASQNRLSPLSILSRIVIIAIALTPIFASCSSKSDSIGKDPGMAPDTVATDTAASDTAVTDTVETVDYHADNDIAMTVRSIADAISVGEELIAEDYEFHGVLTDGSGRPLYTSPTGAPGIWTVRVASGKAAEITPDMPGNIEVGDLQKYVTSTLNLGDEQIVKRPQLHNKQYQEWTVYKIEGGYLCYEATRSNERGRESSRIRILLTR